MTELFSVMDVTSESRLSAGYSKAVMPGNGSEFEHSRSLLFYQENPVEIKNLFFKGALLELTALDR